MRKTLLKMQRAFASFKINVEKIELHFLFVTYLIFKFQLFGMMMTITRILHMNVFVSFFCNDFLFKPRIVELDYFNIHTKNWRSA